MLIKLAWRNLWRNKLRTGIVLGAMIFGLVGVTGTMGFMSGFSQNMIENAILWQTSHAQIHNESYPDDPDVTHTLTYQSDIESLLDQTPGILHWSSRHIVNGMISSARSARGIKINGVVPKKEEKITPIHQSVYDGEWLDEEGRNPILVSTKTAERLSLRVGSKIVLTFTDVHGEVTGAAFRVRGLYKTPNTSFDDGNVYVRKADLKTLTQAQSDHEIAMITTSPADSSFVVAALKKELNLTEYRDQLLVRDWAEIQPMLKTMIESMAVFNIVFLVIFVAAMAFGIVNVLLMSVFERTQEFGVLMAVGMDKNKIRGLIVLESGLMGGVGALIGLLLSFGSNAWLLKHGLDLSSFSDGLSAFGMDPIVYPTIGANDYLITLLTVLLVSLLAGLYPARQILKHKPADAMAEKH
jgi:ABC-type lipoprotein release transport system permease subunit